MTRRTKTYLRTYINWASGNLVFPFWREEKLFGVPIKNEWWVIRPDSGAGFKKKMMKARDGDDDELSPNITYTVPEALVYIRKKISSMRK